jgi:hypothetical protein
MEKEKIRGLWGATTGQYGAATTIPVGKNCYGWRASNKGDGTVIVNNNLLKGFPPGHPELSGESCADIHPLALPMSQEWISIAFENNGTINAVQITYYTNY